jgi:NAD(P)-dependent dehydrogenase (short-subunit alcohol dehydrogenase family)
VSAIATRFGAESTAAEVIAGIDLSGRRAVVTGASSGIGVETARVLAGAGAEVTLAVRDVAAGERTAAGIEGDTRVARLDLADLASVRAFAAAWDGSLHLLVNNAGVMAVPELTRTPEGRELQFATNHLGHFALALGLHGALAAEGGRIVAVSSSAHLRSPVVFDDLDFRFRDYDPWAAYGQSKTANVLFAVGATARWADAGIFANALMPGGIATNLQRHLEPGYMQRVRGNANLPIKTVEQGAATSVLVATAPELEGVGGRYFEDCNEAPVVGERGGLGARGVAPYALDPDNADRLWEVSSRLVNA